MNFMTNSINGENKRNFTENFIRSIKQELILCKISVLFSGDSMKGVCVCMSVEIQNDRMLRFLVIENEFFR